MSMNNLKNKNVLLLSPLAFGYEDEIKEELERQTITGTVSFFDERPKNNFTTKFLIRAGLKKLIARKIKLYYNKIIADIDAISLDFIFLISPETVPVFFLKKMKKINPKIKIFIYMWDSLKNKNNARELLEFSDKIFSFDKADKGGRYKIQFLPLFYINKYKNIKRPIHFDYDIAFIGTLHSDRYQIVEQLKLIAEQKNRSTYSFYYSPSKILFLMQRIVKKEFRKISYKNVSFKSLTGIEVVKIFERSKIIIDIQHPNQTGLTMRAIEVLGAQKKLITTNSDIVNYDFYNPNNIFIFDRDNPNMKLDFIGSEFVPVNETIYEKYTLNNWIKTIFE